MISLKPSSNSRRGTSSIPRKSAKGTAKKIGVVLPRDYDAQGREREESTISPHTPLGSSLPGLFSNVPRDYDAPRRGREESTTSLDALPGSLSSPGPSSNVLVNGKGKSIPILLPKAYHAMGRGEGEASAPAVDDMTLESEGGGRRVVWKGTRTVSFV